MWIWKDLAICSMQRAFTGTTATNSPCQFSSNRILIICYTFSYLELTWKISNPLNKFFTRIHEIKFGARKKNAIINLKFAEKRIFCYFSANKWHLESSSLTSWKLTFPERSAQSSQLIKQKWNVLPLMADGQCLGTNSFEAWCFPCWAW